MMKHFTIHKSVRRLSGLILLGLCFPLTALGDEWIQIRAKNGKGFEAKVINVNEHVIHGKEVIVQRKSDGKTFTIPLKSLSAETVKLIEGVEDEVTLPKPDPNVVWETIEKPKAKDSEPPSGSPAYFPTLDNEKSSQKQPFPLGPIGGAAMAKMGQDHAEITSLDPNGAGTKAGLKVGDKILAANGKGFAAPDANPATGGDGLISEIGFAILESQAEKTALSLKIERAGVKVDVSVELAPMPDFSKNFPVDCERSAYLKKSALDWLVKTYGQNRNFGSGNQYAIAMGGLAVLSEGNPENRYLLQNIARNFSATLKSEVPNSNWIACAMGIYLAEYYLATGEKAALPALERCCEEMADRITPKSGRLGHNGNELPYEGKGLVITTAHAHLMWALAEQAGIALNKDAWKLSYRSVEASLSDNGSVGYNFSATGSTQSMARTGAMAAALEISGNNGGDCRNMKSWLSDNFKRATNGHSTGSLGMIFGFIGTKQAGERAHRKNLDYHQWLLALCSPAESHYGAYYFGIRGNFTGDSYLNYQTVANYQLPLLINSGRSDTLWVFGNRKQKWLRD